MYGLNYIITDGGAVQVYREDQMGSVILLEYWDTVEHFIGDMFIRLRLVESYMEDPDSVMNEMKVKDNFQERLEKVVTDMMTKDVDIPDCIINDKDILDKLGE